MYEVLSVCAVLTGERPGKNLLQLRANVDTVLETSQFFPQPPQPGWYLLPEDSAENAPIGIS